MRADRFQQLAVLNDDPDRQVWLVEDRSRAGTRLVWKSVRAAARDDLERLGVEYSLARGIEHPNLTRVVEFERDGDEAWILREYVPGRTLRDEASSLDPVERRRVLVDVLRATAALHRESVLHLDIKPDNVLIRDADRAAILTDFGLSRRFERGEGRVEVVGTPPFIAPELLLGLPPDPRADLFSIAATMVMIHDVPRVDVARFYHHFPHAPFLDAIGVDLEELDPELAPLLARMLASHPSDRPRTADEALDALGDERRPASRTTFAPIVRPEQHQLDTLETFVRAGRAPRVLLIEAPCGSPIDDVLEQLRFVAAFHQVAVHTLEAGPTRPHRGLSAAAPLGDPGSRITDLHRHAEELLETSDDVVVLDARADAARHDTAEVAARIARGRPEGPALVIVVDPGERDPVVLREYCDDALALRPIGRDALAEHLATLEGSPPGTATSRHRDLADRLLDLVGPDVDLVGRTLLLAIEDGHASWSRGRLEAGDLRPAQLRASHPAVDELANDPVAHRSLALLGMLGGTARAETLAAILVDDLTAFGSLTSAGIVTRIGHDFKATPASLARAALERLPDDEARDLAARVIDRRDVPALPPGRRAWLCVLAGRTDAARDILVESAPQEDPTDDDTLIELSRRIEDGEASLAVGRRLVDRRVQAGDLDGARAGLDRLLSRAGNNAAARCQLLIDRGEIDIHRGELDDAEDALQHARRHARAHPHGDVQRLRISRGLGFILLMRGEPRAAADLVAAAKRSWRGARGLPYHWLGVLHATFTARAGSARKARDLLTDVVARLRAHADESTLRDHLIGVALGNLGPILLRTGDVLSATRVLTEARELRARERRPLEEASILNNTSIVRRELGELETSIELAREAARLFGWCGDALGEASARANLAESLARTGQVAAADRELSPAWSWADRDAGPRERVLIGCRVIRLRIAANRRREAAECLSRLLEVSDDLPAHVAAELTFAKAEVAAAEEDWDRALACGLRARDAFQQAEDQPMLALLELRVAEWALIHDLGQPAADHLARCRRLAPPGLLPELELIEGFASARRGAREEAFSTLLRARDDARRIGLPRTRARAAAALAAIVGELDRTRATAFEHEVAAAIRSIDVDERPGLTNDPLLGTLTAEPVSWRRAPDMTAPTDPVRGETLGDAVPLEMFRTVASICRSLSRERDLDRLLDALLGHAVAITGARRGFLLIQRDGTLAVEKTTGDDVSAKDTFSRSIASDAIRQRRPVVTANANADERYFGRRSIEELDLRSVLCAPFHSDGGLVGAIYVDNPVREAIFSARSIDFLEVVADQAAVAITNLELRRELDARGGPQSPGSGEAVAATPTDHDTDPAGESDAWRATLDGIVKVADSELPLLILGESGTGKELLARIAHRDSARAGGPFVAVNVSAVPESLMEAEFFGYVKGAFTGALRDHDGYFTQANGGSLFLDEVGDMPASMQVKLLRALQGGVIRPVGAIGAAETDVRLIAATHRDLSELVASGTFRQDLYFRLRGAVIEVPPLRDRGGDAIRLAEHFLGLANERHDTARRFSDRLLEQVRSYHWPGNVRELANEVRRLFLMAEDDLLDADIRRERREPGGARRLALKPMKELERDAIELALREADGNREQAARLLGIPRTTFYNKLKRLRIGPPDRRPGSG